MKGAPKAATKRVTAGTLLPTNDENEVLRRMLHTPPQPHKAKSAPAQVKKPQKKAP